MQPTAAQLTPLLAGTQCTLCGYPSCAAYAQALATQTETSTTLCVPGGHRVATALQSALNLPLAQNPSPLTPLPAVAFITEPDCIGCTLCLQKCPTAAIVGAPKQLHTILTALCTGCNLCIPVCPTACITLKPAPKHHKLTEQMPDGSLTPAASSATWALVNATAARQKCSTAPTGNQSQVTSHQSAPLQPLGADLLAKIAAARQKNTEKYAAKGPIRQPRALKTKP